MNELMSDGAPADPGGLRRRVRYDRSENEPPSVAVANALAEYHDEHVVTLSTRLYDHVDPEALDALFADRHDGRSRGVGQVRFDVGSATVVVRPERIEVYG